jgi:hypothetical protein
VEIILPEKGTKPNVCIVIEVSILFSIIEGSFEDLSMNNSTITSRKNEHQTRFGIYEEMFLCDIVGQTVSIKHLTSHLELTLNYKILQFTLVMTRLLAG